MSGQQPGDDEAAADGAFVIDPDETIWTVARQLVAGRHTISQLAESARLLRMANPDDPAVLQQVSRVSKVADEWFNGALPNILAAMQVAIEAHDTLGSGFTRVDDPVDAAVWNNKFFVWRERLGGSIDDVGGVSRRGGPVMFVFNSVGPLHI